MNRHTDETWRHRNTVESVAGDLGFKKFGVDYQGRLEFFHPNGNQVFVSEMNYATNRALEKTIAALWKASGTTAPLPFRHGFIQRLRPTWGRRKLTRSEWFDARAALKSNANRIDSELERPNLTKTDKTILLGKRDTVAREARRFGLWIDPK